MNPTLWDHGLVFVALVVVFPFVGLHSYRRFLDRVAVEGEPELIREYQRTIFLWLGGLAVATISVWLAHRRPIEALFTTDRALVDAGLAYGMVAGIGIGILMRPVLAVTNAKIASQFAETMKPVAAFLPKSRRALAWGLAVSIAAGVAEEIAYRGFLIPYLSSMAPMWVSIVASSILFGAAHLYQGWVGVLATTVLGAVFAVVYMSTGTLLLPMLLHALIDVSAMVTAYVVLRPANGSS